RTRLGPCSPGRSLQLRPAVPRLPLLVGGAAPVRKPGHGLLAGGVPRPRLAGASAPLSLDALLAERGPAIAASRHPYGGDEARHRTGSALCCRLIQGSDARVVPDAPRS